MPTNVLTDARVKALRAGDRLVKVFDGHGLFLAILPSGTKSWRMAYRLDGRQQTITFGAYPEVSLAAARARRDEVRAVLRAGGDPMGSRKCGRARMTFAEAAEAYWAGRQDVTDTYRENALSALKRRLYPFLGDLPVGGIDRDQLLAALARMDAEGRHVYVRKTRMWAGQVFGWAVEHGHGEINPADLIRPERAFGRAKVEHFPALEVRELPAFFERMAMEAPLLSVLACRLLALTWVRTGELRFMRWEDVSGDLWMIPAGRMKRKRDHLVPLSPPALALLEGLRARHRGGPYVFPSDRTVARPMSENAILALIARIGYKGRMTGHGFRTVASTWANEQGFSPDAIERQLAHVPENRVRSAYNRAEYLPERRRMLETWGAWVAGLF